MNLKKCFNNIISYDHSHEGSIYTLEIKGSLLNELVEKFKLTNDIIEREIQYESFSPEKEEERKSVKIFARRIKIATTICR